MYMKYDLSSQNIVIFIRLQLYNIHAMICPSKQTAPLGKGDKKYEKTDCSDIGRTDGSEPLCWMHSCR